MQHPVAHTIRGDFDIPRLRHADQHRGPRPPGGLRNAATLCPGDLEGIAVDVHRVVIHAHVHKTYAHPVPLAYDERRGRRTRLAIQQEPVVFHVHGVGHRVVGQHGVLLQVQQEILIAVGMVRRAGMHDEASQHAGHLLHGHVRVVEVGSSLVDIKFVDKLAARLHWFLADARHAVIADHVFESMPVKGAWLGQMVLKDDADVIALGDLYGRPRRSAIESP